MLWFVLLCCRFLIVFTTEFLWLNLSGVISGRELLFGYFIFLSWFHPVFIVLSFSNLNLYLCLLFFVLSLTVLRVFDVFVLRLITLPGLFTLSTYLLSFSFNWIGSLFLIFHWSQSFYFWDLRVIAWTSEPVNSTLVIYFFYITNLSLTRCLLWLCLVPNLLSLYLHFLVLISKFITLLSCL